MMATTSTGDTNMTNERSNMIDFQALSKEVDDLSIDVLTPGYHDVDATTHVLAAETLVTLYGQFTLATAHQEELKLSFDALRLADVHLRLAEFKRSES
jgi:hypothetical protein